MRFHLARRERSGGMSEHVRGGVEARGVSVAGEALLWVAGPT